MPKKFGTNDWVRFAEQAFIERLWNKLIGYLSAQPEIAPERNGCEQHRSVNPLVRAAVVVSMWARFRPVFERLVWIQEVVWVDLRRWRQLRRLAEASAKQIADTYGKFLIDGDYASRNDLENLIANRERRFEVSEPSPTKRPKISWHCWAALAALQSPTSGIVPTRKRVIAAAIECRAVFELMDDFLDHDARIAKIDELRNDEPRNWKRIIRELDLTGLPRSEQRYSIGVTN